MSGETLQQELSKPLVGGRVVADIHVALGGTRRARRIRAVAFPDSSPLAEQPNTRAYVSADPETDRPRIAMGFFNMVGGEATASIVDTTATATEGPVSESAGLVVRAIIASMQDGGIRLAHIDLESSSLSPGTLDVLPDPNEAGMIELKAARQKPVPTLA